MSWQIVDQIVKDCPVPIKHVRFAPKTDDYGNTTFIRLKNTCLRVLFRHSEAAEDQIWKATYTKHGFNVTCPNRTVFVHRYPSSETQVVPGRAINGEATTGSMNLRKFMGYMEKEFGIVFASIVVNLFLSELGAVENEAA